MAGLCLLAHLNSLLGHLISPVLFLLQQVLDIMMFFLCDFAEVDEPPRSDAGQDVVIQLPTDWAVLDGRDSVDDHGISHYEWTLVKGDTAINMKVSER